jgi:D-alanyl-D-alanine endopeptidase (penicillin-binding protein 7)
MCRYAFALFLLFLHTLYLASPAWAKETTRSAASARKHLTEKSTAAKQKVIAASKKKRRAKPAVRTKVRKKAKAKSTNKLVKRIITVRGKRKVIYTRAPQRKSIRHSPPVRSAGDLAGLNKTDDALDLRSNAALVLDPSSSEVLFAKNSDAVLPIASITKLMTALIVVESGQDMDEIITVTEEDIDQIKHTSSRLRIGSRLTRANMLHIALMSSENRAASALGRHYPGGLPAFVAAMNAKAKALAMKNTRYVEPTGLSSQNVSTASDLAKLVMAAQKHPIIREYSTNREYEVDPGGPSLQYRNSNRLVTNPQWDILVQKTGYISEAGRCLVMQAMIEGRAIVMVFLDAKGKFARAADAGRIRNWLGSDGIPSM